MTERLSRSVRRRTRRKRLEWVGVLASGPFSLVLADKHAYRWPDQGPWERTKRGPAKSWRKA